MPDCKRFDFGWFGPPGDAIQRRDHNPEGELLDVDDVAEVLRDESLDEGGTPYDVINLIANKLGIRL